jgi:hypothetical protein
MIYAHPNPPKRKFRSGQSPVLGSVLPQKKSSFWEHKTIIIAHSIP